MALLVGLLLAPTSPAPAQAQFALGVVEKLLSSAIKFGALKLLTNEPEVLTIDEINQALDDELQLYHVKELYEEYLGVMALVQDFDPSEKNTARASDIQAIVDGAAGVVSKLGANIGPYKDDGTLPPHPENFWKLLTPYVMARSVQLTFELEKYRTEPTPVLKQNIGAHARTTLDTLKDYFLHFTFPARGDCFEFGAGQKLFTSLGHDVPDKLTRGHTQACGNDWNSMYRRDFNKKWDMPYLSDAYRSKRDNYFWGPYGDWKCTSRASKCDERAAAKAWYFSQDIYHDHKWPAFREPFENQAYYVYKASSDDDRYLLAGPFRSVGAALRDRAQHSLDRYQKDLGSLRGVIAHLGEIATTHGDAATASAAQAVVDWFLGS